MDWVTIAGTLLGVLSLILTFIVAKNTNKIKGKVALLQNIGILKAERETIMNDLLSTLDLINESGSRKEINQLNILLRKLDEYVSLMNKEDLGSLKKLKALLKSGELEKNIDDINFYVSKIIGFLDLKIDDSSNFL